MTRPSTGAAAPITAITPTPNEKEYALSVSGKAEGDPDLQESYKKAMRYVQDPHQRGTNPFYRWLQDATVVRGHKLQDLACFARAAQDFGTRDLLLVRGLGVVCVIARGTPIAFIPRRLNKKGLFVPA